jgi:formate hydrogenlyase subunit 6/NADH:ubiquinone oxidoreductase subunit I
MMIGTMFSDVVRSFFIKPATQLYPRERIHPAESYRGKLTFSPAACTGCGLCVKDCPAKAIELITLDRATKRFVMTYHMERCLYCGQCEVSCKFKCIDLAHDDWEHAALGKEEFTLYYGKPEDIRISLAKLAQQNAESKPG